MAIVLRLVVLVYLVTADQKALSLCGSERCILWRSGRRGRRWGPYDFIAFVLVFLFLWAYKTRFLMHNMLLWVRNHHIHAKSAAVA